MTRRLAVRPLLVPLLALLAWEVAARAGLARPQLLPPPAMVVHRLWTELAVGGLAGDVAASLLREAAGFVIGASAGVALGLVLGLSRAADRVVGPLFLSFRQIALFAWVPLLSMWFGGGEAGKVAFVALATLAPTTINTWRGTRGIAHPYVELAHVLTFRRLDFIRFVALPGALPSILTGLRSALIVAWLATIGAELFLDIAPGLGGRMNEGRETFQMDLVVASIVVLGSVGLCFSWLAASAESTLLRRRTA